MENGEKNITVIDENGNETLCEILLTFDSEQFGKSYVLYTPVGSDDENEDEELEIHAYSYNPGEGEDGGELMPIETEEEWDMIEEMVNTFFDEQEEEDNE
ncbi:DUF1292 domain-containing protein [Pseudoneobacillus rhizosphaerae]|jgi:uncharacterized protein YrzB (UPF0473 family)|uniref:UPF0473 protein NEOCIP111885_01689 n=1 Tax=Pseudoneobacillus rhizosphaerae TaxID=2880968 RepID=A0A9C7LA27_9BACI|nr:DUF1292 domain-containing protein [Pseudoneobacillus rhizosphaerae]CAG9607997.1 hypothetical protein NEOCIP111885_01689 [Pseudoneobacillus rhizosphaerae]